MQIQQEVLQRKFDQQSEIINSISFNSDNSCLALATSRGFQIFSTSPIKLKRCRDLSAPLQYVEMVDRTNMLAFIGFENTAFVADKVAIFDDNTNNIIGDMSFSSNILAIKIRLKKMIIALSQKVYVIDFLTLEIQHVLPTLKYTEIEKYNLISMSCNIENMILAIPAYQNGHVNLVYFDRNKQRKIKAHQSLLSVIVLTVDGNKLATSSQKGMNIRIFCTQTGQLLQEVRRGNEYGLIYSLQFNRNGNWLVCTSDSCNVHVFAIKLTEQEKSKKYDVLTKEYQNPKSKLYFLRKILPYFDAEYSYCSYIMNDYEADMQSWAAFGFHDDSIMVINDYANFKKIEVNLDSGKCKQLQQEIQLLQIQNEEKDQQKAPLKWNYNEQKLSNH